MYVTLGNVPDAREAEQMLTVDSLVNVDVWVAKLDVQLTQFLVHPVREFDFPDSMILFVSLGPGLDGCQLPTHCLIILIKVDVNGVMDENGTPWIHILRQIKNN